MRVEEESSRAFRERQREEAALRELVFKIVGAVGFVLANVRAKCDAAWRARVALMPYLRLKRELHNLLAHCGFRRIAQLYKKFGVRCGYFVLFVGEYLQKMKMEKIGILQPLMEHYTFCVLCKYYFLFLI